MQSLIHKRLIVGVTGSIAAYKSAELIRLLKQAGADVRVVMTSGGAAFITPLTLQAVSGRPVHRDLLDPISEAAMGHIELAKWADAIIVAPASANFLSRLACGRSDDLLTALCLASRSPLLVAPAMNQAMWQDAATEANHQLLLGRGIHVLGPAHGEQACGDLGPGRMLEAEELLTAVAHLFETGSLAGKQVVITAGPTREAIDPVRYISNHSSGKMGFALAQACIEAGARVTLISGPVALSTPEHIERIDVISAQEMLTTSLQAASACDIFIGAAAVADYRIDTPAVQKIKKSADEMTLTLIKNPDILAAVAKLPNHPFTVGFAAETENLLAHAEQKRVSKGVDMIIANDVSRSDIGFDSDENAVSIFRRQGVLELPQASKYKLARQLVEIIAESLN